MSGSARSWQPSLLDTEALDHATAVLYVVAVFHGGSAGRLNDPIQTSSLFRM